MEGLAAGGAAGTAVSQLGGTVWREAPLGRELVIDRMRPSPELLLDAGPARDAAHVRVRDPGVFCSPRRPRSASQPARGPAPQVGEDQAALGEVAVGRIGDLADQVLRSQPAGVFETFGQAVQGAGPRHDEGCLVRGEER
jgi:hypothetical protein